MTGVNHKTIKQLVYQKKKTITDRQFFSSRVLAGHFSDMATAQTKRYGYNRRVKVRIVWQPKDGNAAFTDNNLIWINAGNSMVTKERSRVDRYNMVCGFFAHELGHLLYTDFLAAQTFMNYFNADRWYPEAPPMPTRDERMNADDMWVYAKSDDKHRNALLRLLTMLWNVLEDGYIESKMLDCYPGVLGENLTLVRETDFDLTPTLTQMIEWESAGKHIWLTIQQLMLSYVKFGELKYGEEPISDERVQVIFSLLSELDQAITDSSAKERWNVVNTIAVRCWPYIKDFLDLCEKMSEDATASGGSASSGDIVSELMSELAGCSQEASGDTEPVAEKSGTTNKASAGSKRRATARQAAASKSSDSDGKTEDDENAAVAMAGGDSEEDDKGAESESGKGDADESESGHPMEGAAAEDEGCASESHQHVSSEETGRMPLEQTDHLSAPIGGETSVDEEYTGSGYANSAGDIERLLETVAENAVTKTLENERTASLNELAQNMSFGNIHEGVNIKIHRMPEVSEEMIDGYNAICGPLLHISKLLQQSVKQKLIDQRRGGKQTSLLMGRRLDTHTLTRTDGHVFCKSALPNDMPTIAVGLLNDESGSMSSKDRVTYARVASIIIYDFCIALGIPITVYGHTTGYNTVDLYSYAEFDAIDKYDKYRLMDISARNSNRDGAALRFVAEQLSKRPEEIKLLILVSDGQPADSGYSGTAAEEDLRGIKHEYHKKDVRLIAAAIGDDKPNIERIYGDSFLDITDLNRLPIMLTNKIKQHIRV